jgi:hypothetical protein
MCCRQPQCGNFLQHGRIGKMAVSSTRQHQRRPYAISLNVSDLGGIKETLEENNTKYISLDFSGSTITIIPEMVFNTRSRPISRGCITLTGVIISNSITSIENGAFYNCYNCLIISPLTYKKPF